MTPASYFAQNRVWQVYFDVTDSLAEVTLTYRRLLADGTSVKFDEDSHGVLDLSTNADDHIVLDGFLSFIPDGELLSCAMRDVKHVLLIWEREDYQHIFAQYDKQIVRTAFEGRLWNPDSSADFLFVGGNKDGHTTPTIKHWAKVMQEQTLRQSGADRKATIDQVLGLYSLVAYTQTAEIHILTSNGHDQAEKMKATLGAVASRYGMALPPE